MISNHHQSVMFTESIDALNIKTGGIYIDATFGRGGHTQGILDKLDKSGSIIAFDQDIRAVEFAKENFNDDRLTVIHSAFTHMGELLSARNLSGKIDGILMDLGV